MRLLLICTMCCVLCGASSKAEHMDRQKLIVTGHPTYRMSFGKWYPSFMVTPRKLDEQPGVLSIKYLNAIGLMGVPDIDFPDASIPAIDFNTYRRITGR